MGYDAVNPKIGCLPIGLEVMHLSAETATGELSKAKGLKTAVSLWVRSAKDIIQPTYMRRS
ncbi:hypothetical protein B9G39_02095 [Zooshikella ganghwensis]|uniref:Uncharacterized protein n=1 Tax=Zooshikella ganghwensis TaxID=202772 RepID=A0A4P9VGP8_9GAMM|nr:hypothetical protein B9G39_02095 [Zooshikella ganghwensis]